MAKWLFGALVVLVGLGSGLADILGLGPLWPIDPDAHPLDASSSSALSLGWEVRDKHSFLDMPNIRFTCGIDLVYAEDQQGQKVIIRDAAFLTKPYSVPAGKPAHVQCTPIDLLQVRSDGSLSLYGSATKLAGPGDYLPPFRILKACMWLSGEYRLLGVLPWTIKPSSIWQWPALPGQPQWVEGPPPPESQVAFMPPNLDKTAIYALRKLVIAPDKLLPNALDCDDEMRFPYTITTGPGRASLIVGKDHPSITGAGAMGAIPLPPYL